MDEDEPMDVRIQRYIQTYYDFMVSHQFESYDIYHAQDCISANALWRIRQDGLIQSFVRTVHHLDDFVSPALIECQNNSIYRPNHLVVVSRYWQELLQDEFHADSEIIYNGVDTQRFQPPSDAQRNSARAELGFTDQQIVFLNIGGIEPRKNTIRLLRAFQSVWHSLAEQGNSSVLLLAGGETLFDYRSYRTEFFEALDNSDLQSDKDVYLLGVVEDDQIPVLYHAADVLALPSVKEGWGLVVLEAMASGLSVQTSDLPVFREYLRSEKNALLVNPQNEAAITAGMLRLAQDVDLRQRLAMAGPETSGSFGWDRTAAAHINFYYQNLPAFTDELTSVKWQR